MSGVNITHLHLDSNNIGTAEIRNNQGKFLNFDFHYTQGTEKSVLFFTLMVEEVRFLLNNPAFLPWFDDGNRCIRVVGDGIYIAPTYRAIDGGDARTVRIVMRHKELFPILEAALKIPEGTSIEFSKEIRRSAEMAIPLMVENWSSDARKILQFNHDKIHSCVEQVKIIARNSSNGQDDRITVSFFKDGDRSLYWNIINDEGRRVMNGGIIWHGDDEKGEYSIHT
jgi:hypothetical protein